ncbi:MAG: LEA type 2 family protein [Bacteroidota bacterium]
MANKKNTGKIVLGIAAVAAMVLITKKAAGNIKSLEYLDFMPSSVKADFSKILAPVLIVKASVSNPNATPVPVKGIFGKVAYNGLTIATFQNDSPVDIGGKKTSTVTITAKLNSLGFVASILNIIQNKNAKKEVLVDGMLQTGLFEQPFTHTLNLS